MFVLSINKIQTVTYLLGLAGDVSVAALYDGGSSYGGGSPPSLETLSWEMADRVPLNIPDELLMTDTTMSGGTPSTSPPAGGGLASSVCPSSAGSLWQTHLHEHLQSHVYVNVSDFHWAFTTWRTIV